MTLGDPNHIWATGATSTVAVTTAITGSGLTLTQPVYVTWPDQAMCAHDYEFSLDDDGVTQAQCTRCGENVNLVNLPPVGAVELQVGRIFGLLADEDREAEAVVGFYALRKEIAELHDRVVNIDELMEILAKRISRLNERI